MNVAFDESDPVRTGSNATVHFRDAKNLTASHFSFLIDLLATCDFKEPLTISTNEKLIIVDVVTPID